MALTVNKNFFIDRVTRIYNAWESDVELRTLGSLIFCVGANTDDNPYSKSQSLQTWLFNCSLPDTLLVLTKGGIYFLGSDKKAQFFAPLESKSKENLNPAVPPFSILQRNKADKDKENFAKLFRIVMDAGTKCGYFAKDKPDSAFSKAWDAILKEKDQNLMDISLQFASLFATKDDSEIALLKKSAQATVQAWNHLRRKIVDIVDTDKRIKQSKIAEDLEKAMVSVQVQGDLVKTNALEICYSPIIQSGENCQLKFSASSPEKLLQYGSIVSTLGVRYMSYCTNVARTLMVMPTPLMEELYELLLSTETAIVEALKPGVLISDAYKAGFKHFQDKKPEYAQYLVKNFGFVTGIEFREGQFLISDSCPHKVERNMVFIVAVGLQNFPNKGAESKGSPNNKKTVSIFLSDTVLVCENGPNEVLTMAAKSRLRSNAIRFREEDKQQKQANEVEELPGSSGGRTKRSVVLQEQTRHKQTNEEKRKERQRELADQLNKEAHARLSIKSGGSEAQRSRKSNVSYKTEEKFPDDEDVEKMMLFVDKRHDTVIVPIFGVPVPLHISMVKNASLTNEGDFTYLRINFNHPGSQIGKESAQFPNAFAKYLKELTFKSRNVREPGERETPSANLQTAARLIKEMQKRFRTQEAEEREKEGAVKQDKLIIATNGKGNPKLKDLYVRPNIITKRISGILEAHVNGFRYTSLRGDKIDVLYNNIKHAFFQPCDNEMIILLHFHLKHPVLWGKKKYTDVQFFTEVGEITTDLGKYHHMQDRDDIQSEQMEREMRKKLNLAFQNFCDKVFRMTNEQVDFDTPFNDLAFIGAPHRSTVSLKPTSSCLVHLTESPPFVVTLDEVELVHFERVTSNTSTFDMVIVFKDYTKKPHTIGQIPCASLDSIKDWLNSCDIRYSEGPMSLNWANIMKTINEDPEVFFEEGGWNFLLAESDAEGEEGDGDATSESSFHASEDESGASSEDDEDEEEEEEEEDDDDDEEVDGKGSGSGSAELDSDEEEGKDWSDLEEEAAKADRVKAREEFEDDERNRKRKAGAKPSKHAPAAKRGAR